MHEVRVYDQFKVVVPCILKQFLSLHAENLLYFKIISCLGLHSPYFPTVYNYVIIVHYCLKLIANIIIMHALVADYHKNLVDPFTLYVMISKIFNGHKLQINDKYNTQNSQARR